MKAIAGKYPFFLFLLPLFILVHIEKSLHHLINYRFVLKEVLILLLAPFFVYAIIYLFVRSRRRTALLSFVALCFFYFPGEFLNMARTVWPGSLIQKYSVLAPVMVAIFISACWIVYRKQINYRKTYLYLNCAVSFFILADLAALVFSRTGPVQRSAVAGAFKTCRDCPKPDVYYIIFDAYTSSPLLRRTFDYDNSGIDSFLTSNGFEVIRNSRSNYNLTPYCISSTFSMDYLSGIDTTRKYTLNDYLLAVKKVYNSPLFSIFEQQGYEIWNHSIFDVKGHPSSIPAFDEWKISKIFQQYNIIRKVYNETGWRFPSWLRISFGKDAADTYADDRNTHDSNTIAQLYSTISRVSDKPRFVYAHILVPHNPYFFDSSGNRIHIPWLLPPREDRSAYVQQLVYTNSILKRIVEKLRASSRSTVIIIQGDHGYRFNDPKQKADEFCNLNAISFPAEYNFQANDSMSGVNTFRVVLNKLFGQQYPLLPVRNHFLIYK